MQSEKAPSRVNVSWNLDRHDGERPNETPSFSFSVKSLADVPLVGDYVLMPTSKEGRASQSLVKITARRVSMDPPEAGRYGADEDINFGVTLMVEIPRKEDRPDFRPG